MSHYFCKKCNSYLEKNINENNIYIYCKCPFIENKFTQYFASCFILILYSVDEIVVGDCYNCYAIFNLHDTDKIIFQIIGDYNSNDVAYKTTIVDEKLYNLVFQFKKDYKNSKQIFDIILPIFKRIKENLIFQ